MSQITNYQARELDPGQVAGSPPGEDTDGLAYPIAYRQQVKVKTLT